MLGAGVVRIAADALRYFKGKYIRLFPHLDAVSCYCFNGDLNVRAIFWPYVPLLLSSRQLASRPQLR